MITQVAIKIIGQGSEVIISLPRPNRHHHIIHNYCNYTGETFPDHHQQGFLDQDGKFYTRKQAFQHAFDNNQILDVDKTRLGMLFSEDVW